MKEFYENLKKKREEKGVSLEDIHLKSRLSLHYLKAIEEGRIEKLPDGYERIYLRRYAKEIGLDEDEVSRDFDLMTGRLQPAELAKPEKEPKESKPAPAVGVPRYSFSQFFPPQMRSFIERLNLERIQKIFWISLAVVTFIIAGYFTYDQYIAEKSNRDLEIREITISELMKEVQPQEKPAALQNAASMLSPASQASRITIELRSLEETWIREISDNRDTSDYILNAGLKHSLQAAQQVQFLLGRADGVEIWLNGTNLGIMGQEDEVAFIIVTEEGIAQKRLRKVTKKREKPAVADSTAEGTNPDSLN